MGFISAVTKICKSIGSPLGVLTDWAEEPLKIWENQRQEQNRDNEVRRDIERRTGVAKVESQIKREETVLNTEMELRRIQAEANSEAQKSQIRIKEAKENADLQIRMQTEIERINAETEEWRKDQDFQRLVKATEAFATFQEKLSDLNLKTVRAIGEMDLGLRAKAQDLILSKTKDYKALQDQATKDAEEEFIRIEEKFGNNERVKNIMIGAAETKLVSIINNTTKFLDELSIDIQKLNQNIDILVQEGQKLINAQLGGFQTGNNMLTQDSNSRVDFIEDKQILKNYTID